MSTTIEALRSEIEAIDATLIELIARRRKLAQELGEAKRADGLPVSDLSRESEVLRSAAVRARGAGLDEERVRHIFWCLIELSRHAQLE